MAFAQRELNTWIAKHEIENDSLPPGYTLYTHGSKHVIINNGFICNEFCGLYLPPSFNFGTWCLPPLEQNPLTMMRFGKLTIVYLDWDSNIFVTYYICLLNVWAIHTFGSTHSTINMLKVSPSAGVELSQAQCTPRVGVGHPFKTMGNEEIVLSIEQSYTGP